MGLELQLERPAYSGMRADWADFVRPEHFAAAGDSREDAVASSAFSLRELTTIEARTYDVKYPALKAREMFSVFTGLDPAAEAYIWKQYDKTGAAQLTDDYAADAPSIEVVMQEFTSRCLSYTAGYSYSIMDLRRSRMAGIPLEARKAIVARESMERAFEQVAFFGVKAAPTSTGQALRFAPVTQNTNDPLAMYGFTNFPGLTGATGYNGVSGGYSVNDWTSNATTVASIVADFNAMQLSVINTSDGVHIPNAVALPLSLQTILMSTPRSTTFTDDTVLQYIQKVNPWIKQWYWTPMLNFAGLKQDTVTPGPRIMCWERNEENVQLVEPQPFEQLPPQIVNMAYKVICHARLGGIKIPYPKAVTYLDGAGG